MKLRRERRTPLIPMNAMSDVAFLLLIFIMLVSLINYRREVPIDYPEAETAKRTGADKNLELWIDRNGGLYLDGVPAEGAAVENALGELYRGAPDTRVHIIADRNTPYRAVNGVVELLQLLQYRAVSFVVGDE
ncbi:MAG: biopolymer transporter ExbD [Spirochaetaceae bacterium]|nr:biopolymer transporter ExbD [Spirochaetaceae bacterium]